MNKFLALTEEKRLTILNAAFQCFGKFDPSDTRGQILDTDDLNLVEGNVGTETSSMKMFEYTPEEWNDIQQKIDNSELVWQY